MHRHSTPKTEQVKHRSSEESRRAKYREKFKRIISNLITIYGKSKNIHPVEVYSQFSSNAESRESHSNLNDMRLEIVTKYFAVWKECLIQRAQFEANAEIAMAEIFSIIETKMSTNKAKFLYLLAVHLEQK